jgi:hypothetical protein
MPCPSSGDVDVVRVGIKGRCCVDRPVSIDGFAVSFFWPRFELRILRRQTQFEQR